MTKLTIEESQLVEQNHNLIYSFMHKYKLPTDDWYDVCAIGLVNAAKTYRSDDIKFSTYAYSCMFGEMRNELKYRDRHYKEHLSLDYEYKSDKGDSFTIADLLMVDNEFESNVVEELYQSKLMKFFDSCLLNKEEKDVFDLLISGENVRQIVIKLGISRWYVDKHIKSIKRHYKRFFRTNVIEI